MIAGAADVEFCGNVIMTQRNRNAGNIRVAPRTKGDSSMFARWPLAKSRPVSAGDSDDKVWSTGSGVSCSRPADWGPEA